MENSIKCQQQDQKNSNENSNVNSNVNSQAEFDLSAIINTLYSKEIDDMKHGRGDYLYNFEDLVEMVSKVSRVYGQVQSARSTKSARSTGSAPE